MSLAFSLPPFQTSRPRPLFPPHWKSNQQARAQPQTPGEQIKKRRLELHWLQARVAKNIGFLPRDQRAVCFAPRAVRRPVTLRRRRSVAQIRALVTSGVSICPKYNGVLPSVARRRTLRSGCASLDASLRLRSTFPRAEPQTEARCYKTNSLSPRRSTILNSLLRNPKDLRAWLRLHTGKKQIELTGTLTCDR